MDRQILEALSKITQEEQCILQGGDVDKTVYTNTRDFIVDSKKMLEHGRLITLRPHTRFTAFPKHRHNYVEIMYMCNGHTVHTINGTNHVDLQKGELLFLNQYAFHEIARAEKDDIAVNFIVLPQFFDTAFEMMEQDNVLHHFITSSLRQGDEKIGYLYFKVADVLPIQNLVENLVWSIINKQPNRRNINQTTMGLLFLQLLYYTDKIEAQAPLQYDNALVIAVLRQIEENYKSVNLTEIAVVLNQPVSRLSRLIKKFTGQTYKQLLQKKRFTKAVQLLNATTLSVADIIACVGYDNTSYFYREFRTRYRMSPAEYRKQNVCK
ncbi:AraC family transcriptional regulator [Oscillospiraceae bacterium PP1C4]